MSKANQGTKRPNFRSYSKRYRKDHDMTRGDVRDAESRGHRFYPALHCPKCQTRAHMLSQARGLK